MDKLSDQIQTVKVNELAIGMLTIYTAWCQFDQLRRCFSTGVLHIATGDIFRNCTLESFKSRSFPTLYLCFCGARQMRVINSPCIGHPSTACQNNSAGWSVLRWCINEDKPSSNSTPTTSCAPKWDIIHSPLGFWPISYVRLLCHLFPLSYSYSSQILIIHTSCR